MENINKKYFISRNSTIKTAMSLLNVSPHQCLLVVDNKKKLIGTITDGDIRKSILKDANLDRTINSIFNKRPIKVNINKINLNEIKRILKINMFELIPVVNNDNIVQRIYSWDQFFEIDLDETICSKTDLIIMAGGMGKRMAPFTNNFPKALIPVGGEPMIIRILEKYFHAGFRKFFISTNYKKSILKKAINNDFLNIHNSKLVFIDEAKPLGTIGAIKNINLNSISENIIVTNCDTIISENFDNIISNHIKLKSDITILTTNKKFDIPYGEIILDKNNNFINLNEKPILDFNITNSGALIH